MMNVILIITITTEGTLKNLQNNNTNSNKGNVHLSGEGHYENSSGSSVTVEQRLLTLRPSLPTSAASHLCRLLLSSPTIAISYYYSARKLIRVLPCN